MAGAIQSPQSPDMLMGIDKKIPQRKSTCSCQRTRKRVGQQARNISIIPPAHFQVNTTNEATPFTLSLREWKEDYWEKGAKKKDF